MSRDSIVSSLRQCGDAIAGRAIHARILAGGFIGDTFLANLLIQMYARCGSVGEARAVFDRLARKNLFSWTLMIAAYHDCGSSGDAIVLFRAMALDGGSRPDAVLLVTVLGAVAAAGTLALGEAIHEQIDAAGGNLDVFVGSALVSMYGRRGSVDRAAAAFDRIEERNIVAWNAMLTAYAQAGDPAPALQLAAVMDLEGLDFTDVSYICILEACALLGSLPRARSIYQRALASGLIAAFPAVGNSAVDALARCGGVEDARSAFESIDSKTVVSWTAMVAAYVQHGRGGDAIAIFRRMDLEGSKPNEVTMINILGACSGPEDLARGRALSRRVLGSGHGGGVIVSNCLIGMYGRCGSSAEALAIFAAMRDRSTASWNAAIAAVAREGDWSRVFELHREMIGEGVAPDGITSTVVLYACSHSGSLEQGCCYFTLLGQDFGIDRDEGHYSCLIDMLGRAGRVREAEEVIEEMPCPASFVARKALLAACRTQSNVDVARNAFQLQSESASYVMLSDLFRQLQRR
ncbi:pentatricopeptide repeat-containing protein At1g11290, chloroplastic [Selaginella moellendorffii]|nr:pentatricopeptide repeat-containing protein At1g11290, chloroplastic [Selaginella moellendorffii]|eukprot:XP_002966293.2 pentatricopeptide repeat-containing protein At1g11290, chloroplastic [Selaginella moellendorffii]